MEPDALDALIELFLQSDPDAVSAFEPPISMEDAMQMRQNTLRRGLEREGIGNLEEILDILASGEDIEFNRRRNQGETAYEILTNQRMLRPGDSGVGRIPEFMPNFGPDGDKAARGGDFIRDLLQGGRRIGRAGVSAGRTILGTNPLGAVAGLVLEEMLIGLLQNEEFRSRVGEGMQREAESSTQRVGGTRRSPTGA